MEGTIFAVGNRGDLLTKLPGGKIVILQNCEDSIKIGDKINYYHTELPGKKYDFGVFQGKEEEIDDIIEVSDSIDTSILSEFSDYSDFGAELRFIHHIWKREYKELLTENGKRDIYDTFQEGLVFAAKKYLADDLDEVQKYISIMTDWCDSNRRKIQGIVKLQAKFDNLGSIVNFEIKTSTTNITFDRQEQNRYNF